MSEENYISEHSVVVAYACGAVAALLGFVSESVHQKLACAAFLHDLRIDDQRLARFQTVDQLRVSGIPFDPETTQQFLDHPAAAAALAREAQGMPSEVDTIVEQHHKRPDGSGFPSRTELPHHPLAAIFIVL